MFQNDSLAERSEKAQHVMCYAFRRMGSISIVMEFFATNLDEATPGTSCPCQTAELTKCYRKFTAEA